MCSSRNPLIGGRALGFRRMNPPPPSGGGGGSRRRRLAARRIRLPLQVNLSRRRRTFVLGVTTASDKPFRACSVRPLHRFSRGLQKVRATAPDGNRPLKSRLGKLVLGPLTYDFPIIVHRCNHISHEVQQTSVAIVPDTFVKKKQLGKSEIRSFWRAQRRKFTVPLNFII